MPQWLPVVLKIKPRFFLLATRLLCDLVLAHPCNIVFCDSWIRPHIRLLIVSQTWCVISCQGALTMLFLLPSSFQHLPPRRHLSVSEDTFGYHNRRQMLPASSGWRAGMPLNFLQSIGQPHNDWINWPKMSRVLTWRNMTKPLGELLLCPRSSTVNLLRLWPAPQPWISDLSSLCLDFSSVKCK